eukprot:522999-Prymnesium_polylepis.1
MALTCGARRERVELWVQSPSAQPLRVRSILVRLLCVRSTLARSLRVWWSTRAWSLCVLPRQVRPPCVLMRASGARAPAVRATAVRASAARVAAVSTALCAHRPL